MISSNEASLGNQEDASKLGRKIDDIDKDAEITLVDETQGRYGDDLMFDTCDLDDDEVFVGQDIKEINVAKKEVNTANPVTTTSVETLIEIRSAKPKVKGVVIGETEKPTKRKDQIRHDKEVAQRLQAQMQAELEEEDSLKLFDKAMKRVNTFVDMDTELVEGSEVRAEGSETRAEGSSKRAGEELE
ncbi:hypothetical protein Tco_1538552 [Tanacetum coccineum]